MEKSGSWFSYGDLRLGQGKENVRTFLKENRDVAEEIEGRLLVALGIREEVEQGSGDEAPAVKVV